MGIMPDANDLLIRQLTEHLPANSAAAKLLRFAFDDGTEDDELAEAKQNTIGAVLDLIYALRGAVTACGITMTTARMLGRTTASTGAIEEITVGSGLSLTGGALTAEVTSASMAAAISAAVTALFENKGNLDASGNPNYPAATLNDAYRISVAGRVGGASGPTVSVGDWVIAIATNAGGDQAAVGASWDIWEGNIPGLTADGLSLIQAASFAAMRALLDLEAGTDFNAYRGEVGKLNVTGSDIASATTPDIGAAIGDFVNITGTTTITGFAPATAGFRRLLKFEGVLQLTHHATSMILPTGANITTEANDIAEFVSLGSGNWRCIRYQRADGTPLAGGGAGGGASIAYPKTFFVSASLGDDDTGAVGNPALPYATAQAAFDAWMALASSGQLHVMDGSVGGIALAADMSYTLHLTGNGPAACNLGGLNANGVIGASGSEDADGAAGSAGFTALFTSDYSINCGVITGVGGAGGHGGTPSNVNTHGGAGGASAPMRLLNMLCDSVTIYGGSGGNGSSYDGNDNGGNGGSVQDVMLSGMITRDSGIGINICPGAAGSGWYPGTDGTAGMALIIHCRLVAALNVIATSGGVLNNTAQSVSVSGGAVDGGNNAIGQIIAWL